MVYAQDTTRVLSPVMITAPALSKFGAGAHISSIDSATLANYPQTNLAQLLSSQSTVFIKQYGEGMLASLSFRGTGASHTTILWNGLQVGYPQLGQADLALIPTDFVGSIDIVHGSSSARFGTGAIGGSLLLQPQVPAKGNTLTVVQSLGSFGTSNSRLAWSKAGANGYMQVGGYYKTSKNNFPYRSANGDNLGRQQNAGFNLLGMQLNSGWQFSPASQLSVHLQAGKANRDLQGSIGSTATNNQKDDNLWGALTYQHQFLKGSWQTTYGFLYDNINYNGSATDSYQHKLSTEGSFDLRPSLALEAGVNFAYIKVNSASFTAGEGMENRSHLFASLRWSPFAYLALSANVRQGFVTGYQIPFTPSVGADWQLLRQGDWQLNLVSQWAKGYRVPTLNDRYWNPGGNPNLLPEQSQNAEVGVHVKNKGPVPFRVSATAYRLWVQNWILWLPNGSVWSPENKRKVKGTGLELEMSVSRQVGQTSLKLWVNYAFTASVNQEPLDAYDRTVGKQLPYVPLHNGNATAQLNTLHWLVRLNGSLTGKRFVTGDNETEVPGYALLDIRLGYRLQVARLPIHCFIDIKNVTNTNYQSIINRAMPGIHFLAGVALTLNN